MADAKPGDFFLGAMEFFAILLPGAALVYLIQPWMSEFVPASLLPKDRAEAWAAFAVSSYVVGHLLLALTAQLDPFIYDDFYLPRFQRHHHQAVQAIAKSDAHSFENETLASTLVARVHFQARGTDAGTSLYDWCLSFARLKNSAAAAEVDRYQGESKFFRSLTVVLLIAALLVAPKSRVAAAFAFVLVPFSLWRFCELRWRATKRVYEYYLLIHYYPEVAGERPKSGG